jgi:DNA-binding NarL/FixJ family response regulator
MVKIAAVLDSTCLIGLERIGRLDVIPALLDPVCAPPAVETEFGSRPEWLGVEAPADSSMVAALRRLRDDGVHVNILLYTGSLCRETLVMALRHGPLGFVEKTADLSELREGFARVSAGKSYYTPMAEQLLRHAGSPAWFQFPLTKRETEVLRLLALGNTSKEVAATMGISPRTVENHRAHIMTKLGCHDITAMTRYAVRENIISADAV